MYSIAGKVAILLRHLDNCYVTIHIGIHRSIDLESITVLNPAIICSIDKFSLDKKTEAKIYNMSGIEMGRLAKEILSHLEHIRLIKTFISNKDPLFNRSTEKIIEIKKLVPYLIYDSCDKTMKIRLEFNGVDIFIINELMSFPELFNTEHSIYDRAIVNLCIKGDFLMDYEIS